MGQLKKHKSVAEALQYVADHPQQTEEAPLDMPVWELISQQLFNIANGPDPRVKGSMARATRAQKMILDRLVGTRRAGTRPAVRKQSGLEFADLTGGEISE